MQIIKKLQLQKSINKFYRIFGEVIGSVPTHLKAIAIALAIVSTLAIGYFIGRSNTIRQAELLETTNDSYFINFGDEVHEYTFE